MNVTALNSIRHGPVVGQSRNEHEISGQEDFARLTRLYEPPVELAAAQCAKVRTADPVDQTVTNAIHRPAGLKVESSCPSL
jgi:hypothetical protein